MLESFSAIKIPKEHKRHDLEDNGAFNYPSFSQHFLILGFKNTTDLTESSTAPQAGNNKPFPFRRVYSSFFLLSLTYCDMLKM